VVSLDCYWRSVLEDRLKQAVRREYPENRSVYLSYIKVVVSVTQYSIRPITMEIDASEMNWVRADNQLIEWSPYFRNGKRFHVEITFKYVEDNPQSTNRAVRRAEKRGRTSASSRMRADRVRQIEAECEATGLHPRWPEVYAFMRCRKQSCESAPHCWIDSDGKHYKMIPVHLNRLVEHVKQTKMLESHRDVPLDLQHQLIAEDRERRRCQGNQGNQALISKLQSSIQTRAVCLLGTIRMRGGRRFWRLPDFLMMTCGTPRRINSRGSEIPWEKRQSAKLSMYCCNTTSTLG